MQSGFKAVIFDLDGTAIPNGYMGPPSPVLVQAIRQARRGLVLAAATGRPWANCGELLMNMELSGPAIVAAGSQIVSVGSREVLWESSLEHGDIAAVLLACSRLRNEVLFGEELIGQGGPAASRVAIESTNVVYVMGCSADEAARVKSQLAPAPRLAVTAGPSWTGSSVDLHITRSDATKFHAVTQLQRMLGLSVAECIGVGDGENDLELFRAVAHRVAVEDGARELLEIADETCPSVEREGFAQYLMSLVM